MKVQEELLPVLYVKDDRRYEEFVAAVRGRMSDKRSVLVQFAFAMVDIDARSFMSVNQLMTRFDAANPPAVLLPANHPGKKSAHQVSYGKSQLIVFWDMLILCS